MLVAHVLVMNYTCGYWAGLDYKSLHTAKKSDVKGLQMILGLVFYYLIMQWNSNILNVIYSKWLWWSQSNILLNNTNLMRKGASWRHCTARVKPLFWPVSNQSGVWIRVFFRWTSPAVLTKFLLVGKIIPEPQLAQTPEACDETEGPLSPKKTPRVYWTSCH